MLLVWLALPRLVAGAFIDPHAAVLARLTDGRPVAASAVHRAIDAYERGLAWSDDPRRRAELGQLYFAAARQSAPGSRARQAFLERVIAAHRKALAESPAQPFAWTQLALALAETEGVTSAFVGAFRAAVHSAPMTPQLVIPRVHLGLRLWPELGAGARGLVVEQLRVAAELMPGRLAGHITRPTQRRLSLQLLIDRPPLRCRLAAAYAGRSPAELCRSAEA